MFARDAKQTSDLQIAQKAKEGNVILAMLPDERQA